MSANVARAKLAVLLSFVAFSVSYGSPCETALSRVASALEAMRANRQEREAAAQAAADRFLVGGKLWVAGSIPRFDIEWLGRAGGLMPVAVMKDVSAVAAGDVLAYGSLRGSGEADAERLGPLREKGALVIAFCSESDAGQLKSTAAHVLTNGLPDDVPMVTQVAASLDIAQLWAFTGDFIGACTRAGKMPTMWQSVMVPGARDRNAKYRPLRFHDDLQVKPLDPGVLGDKYLADMEACVRGLQGETKQLRAGGAAIRKSVGSGHTVFHANMGHFEPARLLPEDFPVRLSVLPRKEAPEELRTNGKKGDAALLVWYTDMPVDLLAAARDIGAASVCLVASNPAAPHDESLADVFLDPQWQYGDALVEVPGYDIKVLPPSGVLNSLVFWAVLAEAAAD